MNTRIRYIDAMRGFTMFLVVVGHVFTFSFGYHDVQSSVSSLFLTFRMPLFFFISGFIAYKERTRWSHLFFIENIRKKARVQLIPTVFFFLLSAVIWRINPIVSFFQHGFGRFWFTFVLFEMFVVYFSIVRIAKIIGKNEVSFLCAIAIICIAFTLAPFRDFAFCRMLRIEELVTYFPYFTVGIISRKKEKQFYQLIENDKTKTLLIISFVLLWIFNQNHFSNYYIDLLRKCSIVYVIRYVGLFLVLATFVGKKEFFAENGKCSRIMQFVGKRTLDIYMLHTFFLPSLPMLETFFRRTTNPLLELLCAGAIAVLVISACLFCSMVIRNSEFLGHYLFGVKRSNREF